MRSPARLLQPNTPVLAWEPARVGCYWNAGPYHIGTVHSGDFTGYELRKDRELIGRYFTLDEAQWAAGEAQR